MRKEGRERGTNSRTASGAEGEGFAGEVECLKRGEGTAKLMGDHAEGACCGRLTLVV